MSPINIARVCHEANRALQKIQADQSIPVSAPWEELDQHYVDSSIDGVRGVLNGSTPEQSHENWMAFKLENGWRLGPVKDEAKKEHPLLVPYAELDDAARVKDDLFVAIVKALAP